MEDIKYILPSEAKFYMNKGAFLALKLGQKEYARVSLHRAFPFSYTDNFISVRDNEGKEIGLIKDIKEFHEGIVKLFKEELDRRYLLPSIKTIKSLKEEFGHSYWDVLTSIGAKRFIMKRDNSSFVNVSGNRILLIDVDGNRYEISDYTKLDDKSYKLIELFI